MTDRMKIFKITEIKKNDFKILITYSVDTSFTILLKAIVCRVCTWFRSFSVLPGPIIWIVLLLAFFVQIIQRIKAVSARMILVFFIYIEKFAN